ncbi:hypothetical protein NQ315_002242 [Exocentrus adspersus]|uniref:Uncharacterized protein n=1 Tax=Exocentrus adspersus TaxID=1586481 RepID=A0AAV8VZW6_9CUCU|nr:hypothetical protein NQ315_002242 [Exocentrus adspersus]
MTMLDLKLFRQAVPKICSRDIGMKATLSADGPKMYVAHDYFNARPWVKPEMIRSGVPNDVVYNISACSANNCMNIVLNRAEYTSTPEKSLMIMPSLSKNGADRCILINNGIHLQIYETDIYTLPIGGKLISATCCHIQVDKNR